MVRRAANLTEFFDAPSSRDAFEELGGMTESGQPLNDILERTVHLVRQVLPFEMEASITLIEDTDATTPAFTGKVALELDETQYSLGYGPCLAAAEVGQLVAVPDLVIESRWPQFARDALDKGVGSTLSVPLPIQQRVVGALNLYAAAPCAFDSDVEQLTKHFGAYAAVAITNTNLYLSAWQRAEQLTTAMKSRAVIEQAKGMLMAQRKCDADEAFDLLVKLSQQTGRKLHAVAAALVEHSISG
jgi:GAF domain-containing protein